MKIELTKPVEIKGVEREAGTQLIVAKPIGERLIEEGLANRIIEETENRIVAAPSNRGAQRICAHTRFTRGVGHS